MAECTEPKGVVTLKGKNWPWMVTEETLDALQAYSVWEDDVWIIGFPKSGVHWTREIVQLIFVDGHEHKIDRDQDSIPAEFDLTQTGRFSKRPPRPAPQFKAMEEWEAPRAIMSNITEELMPNQIYQGKGKVVYVVRNPKDVFCSSWHFMNVWKFDPRHEDWNTFFQMYTSGESLPGSWFSHVLDFWNKHRYDKNFLFLKYEDMTQDLSGAVIRISNFLGKHLTQDALDRVIEFGSFQSMKTRFHCAGPAEDGDKSPQTPKVAAENTDGKTGVSSGRRRVGAPALLRKGIVGDWKTRFTVAQNEAFDKLYEEKIAGSELTLQFE